VSTAIKRNMVVQRWGTPQETVGSLNEPREREEHGHRFNEKWIYRAPRDDPRRPRQRMIYWLRYDFVAAFVIDAQGRLVRDDLPTLLEGTPDRLYRPTDGDALR
jgi:hypothetical protein